MDKYAVLNKQLSGLLGHVSSWSWTHDTQAAMVLQAEYQVNINWYATLLIAKAWPCPSPAIVYLDEHPDTATALRYAIVRAVVELLMRKKAGMLHEPEPLSR